MILVCGIHGVGKTVFCKKLSRELGKETISASELIIRRTEKDFYNKKVDDIILNQKYLLEEVGEIKKTGKDFILDGHLCLINQKGRVKKIDSGVIEGLGIELIIILVDKPAIIKRRLEKRNNINWQESFIDYFQSKEIEYGRRLGSVFDIDYQVVVSSNADEGKFGQSIILPINPVYAKKIFDGEKRYEYRKRLCKQCIDKIYLYSTWPVKKVVGECEVRAQYTMEKEKAWEITREYSGIERVFYEEYYRNEKKARWYVLENIIKYDKSKELSDFGINYTPQSYSYVKTF